MEQRRPTGSLVGDTITLSWAGGPITSGTDYSAVFAITSASAGVPAGVPEISASALGSGIVLVSGVLMLFLSRRKIHSPGI
jgi:hypothetical protein